MSGSTRTRGLGHRLALIASLAICLFIAAAAGGFGSAAAQTARASSCSGVSVTPPAGPVARGGRVLLTGQACVSAASQYAAGRTDRLRINLRKGSRWATVAKATTDRSGNYSSCIRLRAPRSARFARVRVSGPNGRRATARLRLSVRGQKGCNPNGGKGGGKGGGGGGGPGCQTSDADVSSNFLARQSGTQAVWRDDCLSADPMPLYGGFCGARADGKTDVYTTNVNQIAPGRLSLASSGGPSNTPYRQLNIVPGDACWNNRDALGYNRSDSPVALWHEGQYRMLNTWMRLSQINQTGNWRELFEIKQSQPYPSGMSTDDGVMFEVQQRSGNLVFMSHWHDLWSVPVSANSWVPISVEGMWSADPSKGWLRFRAGGQVSGKFNGANLLRNTQNGSTVPSYLEMGPYQSSSLSGFSEAFAGLTVYG